MLLTGRKNEKNFTEREDRLAPRLENDATQLLGDGRASRLVGDDGAPFLALRYAALVGTRLELLATSVARFFGPPAEALRAAQSLQTGAWSEGGKESPTLPGSEAARVFARWVRSVLAARHGVEPLAVPAPLAALLQALPGRRLVDLHDRARLLVRLSGTGANELLAWEALALSCAGTSRSSPTGNRARSRAA